MKDWKDVYIFISSTFNDMHAERDYLVKKVFPKISEWCMDRKLRLIDIDLRWGITSDESNSLNNRVVEICLDNINKCRPFFICLLGQRRGWVPTKDDIATSTFEKIPEINNYAGNYSVTELEIIHALINPLAMRDEKTDTVKKPERVRNAFFLFRDSSYLETIKKYNPKLLNIYTNKLSKLPEEDDKSLESFKKLIIEGSSEDLNEQWYSYTDYECDFDINQQTLELKNDKSDDDLSKGRLVNFRLKHNQKELSDYVFDAMTTAIGNEYPDRINIIEDQEISDEKQQEEFFNRNLVPVIGRSDTIMQLLTYIEDDSDCPLFLYAEGGTGKTTLMANFIQSLKEKNKRICYRFAGTSTNSMQTDAFLHGIIKELYDNDLIEVEMAEDSIDMSIVELLEQKSLARYNFKKIMKHINHELIVVIDAVNELDEDLDDIIWIPDQLSKGVKFIVTCKITEDLNMFNRFRNKFNKQIELKNFDSVEIRKQMIDQFLSTYLKKISDEEKNQLLEIEATKNPLFLKVLLSELRIYGSFENLRKEIPDFGQTIIKAFDKVIRRLENDTEYKKHTVSQRTIVKIMFGTLAYVRADISVDDIVNVILLREGINQDAAEEIKESLYGIIRQMRDYLIYHGNKLRYFYDSLRIASAEKYKTDKSIIHSTLAEIYKNKLFSDDENVSQKKEAYEECTYHLHLSGEQEELKKLIFNYKFLYNKISICGVEEILNDLKYLDKNSAASILRQALDKAKNNISKSPMALPTYLWLGLENSEDADIKKLLKDAEQMTEYFWLKPFGVNNSIISENKSFNVITIDFPENSNYYEEDGDWYDWYVKNDNLYILKNISEDITVLEIWNTNPDVVLKNKIQLSKNLNIHPNGVFIIKENYMYYHKSSGKVDKVFKINMATGMTDLFSKEWNIKAKPSSDFMFSSSSQRYISRLNIITNDYSEKLEKAYLVCAKNDSEVIICDINSNTVEIIYFNEGDLIYDIKCYGIVIVISVKNTDSEKFTLYIYTIHKDLIQKYESVEKYSHQGKNLGIIIDSKYYLWDLDSIELISTVTIPIKYDKFEMALEGMYTPYKKIDFFENSAAIYSRNNIYIFDMKDKSHRHLYTYLRKFYMNKEIKNIKVCSHIAYVLIEYKYGDKKIEQCDIWNLKTFELKSSISDKRFIYSLFEADFGIESYKNVQLISESELEGGGYFVVNSATCTVIGRINKDFSDKKIFIWNDKKAIEDSPGQIEVSGIVDIDLSNSPGGYYDYEFKQCDDIVYSINSIGKYIKVWGRDFQGEEIYSPIILNIEESFIDNDLFVLKTTENKFLFINLKKDSNNFTEESWVANNYVAKGNIRIFENDNNVMIWNNENDKPVKVFSKSVVGIFDKEIIIAEYLKQNEKQQNPQKELIRYSEDKYLEIFTKFIKDNIDFENIFKFDSSYNEQFENNCVIDIYKWDLEHDNKQWDNKIFIPQVSDYIKIISYKSYYLVKTWNELIVIDNNTGEILMYFSVYKLKEAIDNVLNANIKEVSSYINLETEEFYSDYSFDEYNDEIYIEIFDLIHLSWSLRDFKYLGFEVFRKPEFYPGMEDEYIEGNENHFNNPKADDNWSFNSSFDQSKFLSGGFGFPFNSQNNYRMKIHEEKYEILLFVDKIIIKSIDDNQNTNDIIIEFKHNLTLPNRMATYKRVNDEFFIDMNEGFIIINLVTLKHKIILFSDIINIKEPIITSLYYHNINIKESIITSLYYHNSKSIILTKEKIFIIDLEKINCEMEINNTINDKRRPKISSLDDDTVCFVFIDSIYFLNLSNGELINKRVMFPNDLLKFWPLTYYFDGEAYIYIFEHCVYVWSVKSDKVLMRKPLENLLKNERMDIHSNIKINDNYINFFFENTKISVDYINSIVVEQKYLENYEKRHEIIRTFKRVEDIYQPSITYEKKFPVNVWLFDKAIFIQDLISKSVLCEGEHGLKIGQTNKEQIEVVKYDGKLFVLMVNNIIICNLKDDSIKTTSTNINPKYLKKLIEANALFYKEEGSIKISEECIVYQNSLTENISAIPLNNKYAFINDGYIYINQEGKPVRLLPLNTNW